MLLVVGRNLKSFHLLGTPCMHAGLQQSHAAKISSFIYSATQCDFDYIDVKEVIWADSRLRYTRRFISQ